MKKIITITLFFLAHLTFAQEGNPQQVQVKKDKSGTTVYNFNFYNNEEKEVKNENKEKQPITIEEKKDEHLIVYKKKKLKKGTGLEAGLFAMDYFGSFNKVSDLLLGVGVNVGMVFMDSNSGTYYTPGVFAVNAHAGVDGLGDSFMGRNYDATVLGGYFKVGKLVDRGSKFAIDFGGEARYTQKTLYVEDSIFGSGSYDFEWTSISAYAGPVLEFDNFIVSGLLSFGLASIRVSEDYYYYYQYGAFHQMDKQDFPFLGLNVNATYVF